VSSSQRIIICAECRRSRPHAAHAQCIACYQRQRRQGRPRDVPRTAPCASCRNDRPLAANGWCHTCYQRWVRHGRPVDGPPAPKPLQPCGTDAAYQRHVKNGEPIDDRCRQARNDAQNQRRAKGKVRPTTRGQWTDEQTRAARAIAMATADSPTDRRLLLEVLGLVPALDAATTGQRAA
jgi:hypothetical protein